LLFCQYLKVVYNRASSSSSSRPVTTEKVAPPPSLHSLIVGPIGLPVVALLLVLVAEVATIGLLPAAVAASAS